MKNFRSKVVLISVLFYFIYFSSVNLSILPDGSNFQQSNTIQSQNWQEPSFITNFSYRLTDARDICIINEFAYVLDKNDGLEFEGTFIGAERLRFLTSISHFANNIERLNIN